MSETLAQRARQAIHARQRLVRARGPEYAAFVVTALIVDREGRHELLATCDPIELTMPTTPCRPVLFRGAAVYSIDRPGWPMPGEHVVDLRAGVPL